MKGLGAASTEPLHSESGEDECPRPPRRCTQIPAVRKVGTVFANPLGHHTPGLSKGRQTLTTQCVHLAYRLVPSRSRQQWTSRTSMRLPDGEPGRARLPTESPHPNWPGAAAYRGLRHVTLRHHPHPFNPEGPFGWNPLALALLHPPRGPIF